MELPASPLISVSPIATLQVEVALRLYLYHVTSNGGATTLCPLTTVQL